MSKRISNVSNLGTTWYIHIFKITIDIVAQETLLTAGLRVLFFIFFSNLKSYEYKNCRLRKENLKERWQKNSASKVTRDRDNKRKENRKKLDFKARKRLRS